MIIIRESDYPPRIQNPGGETIQELLGLQAGHIESHSLAQITIQPGNSSAPHFHKITDESYLILSGTASMQINGQPFELAPGEAVLIHPMEVHQISNAGKDDLVFLAVCVPAWHPSDSFDQPNL
jgi:mannose-6-phosphate isomerase-like protein (cupin superfamily)